ncbi:regulatory protein GemA [Sinorhizobium meliloti]|uniref:regulatory protein GemA n=1 Tax=Rhizobium meliloti TaxID=382 RepID=UPI0013E363B3|nr:regulatory protein GemA [Sinorhizobium meliloti]
MTAFAAIHLGLKRLGIEGDDARDLYERLTGRRSLRDMSPKQQEAVVEELRRLGFKSDARRPDGRPKLTGRFAAKLQALWIAAHNLGIIENRDDAALIAFVKRQTGIDHVRFLKFPDDARKAVEALKAWIARVGGVDWSDGKLRPDYARADGYKIAWAQWRKLNPHATSTSAFLAAVKELTGVPVDQCSKADWITVMNAFGRRVRATKRKAGA